MVEEKIIKEKNNFIKKYSILLVYGINLILLVIVLLLIFSPNKSTREINPPEVDWTEIVSSRGSLKIISCTQEQKEATFCTMEYMPVCGSDGRTYGNKCDACTSQVEFWTLGECSPQTCTQEQKEAIVCNEYEMLVCGSNGKTYSNPCVACFSKEIESWTFGECPN